MKFRNPKGYQRCKKCRELVTDAANCANCANRNPLSLTGKVDTSRDRAPRLTLDIIEGNSEEALGGVSFAQKAYRA
jgi:hypothetical protein